MKNVVKFMRRYRSIFTESMKQPFFKSIHIIYPLAGLVIAFLLQFMLNFVNTGDIFYTNSLSITPIETLRLCIQMITYLYLVHFAVEFFTGVFENDQNGKWRYFCEVPFFLFSGYFMHKAFHWVTLSIATGAEQKAIVIMTKMDQQVIYCVCALLVFYAYFTTSRVLHFLQIKQAEVVSWERNILQSQFETLKGQLNPHFLFSCLSVLSSLVYIDSVLAEEFIQRLSKTYRYLLDHRDKQSIELVHELQFLTHYEFLMKQRFGSKLHLIYNLNSLEKSFWLPPHTLMLVLEHIIGANRMSEQTPLRIELDIRQEVLQVKYFHNPKPVAAIQQENYLSILNQRYRFKDEGKIITEQIKNGYTTIMIPLYTRAYA